MAAPLAPYPSPEERDTELHRLVDAAGGEPVQYGASVQGRPLLAARLPAASAAIDARVLITANIHGPEFVAGRVAMGALERVGSDPDFRRLRARAEIWIVPCANPDGYARTWDLQGHAPLAKLRANENGVDLNRNFPLPAGAVRRAFPGAGSRKPGAATYIGPSPLSEPESAALAALIEERRFHAGTNGHCFMGRVLPARVTDRHDYQMYKALCAAFAAAQPRARYGRLASRVLDLFTGEMEDFQHHHHAMWAACIESFPVLQSFSQHLRAPSLFWRFNPRDPAPWVENDVPGIAAFLNAALDCPRPSPA